MLRKSLVRSFSAVNPSFLAKDLEFKYKHRVTPNLDGEDFKFGKLCTDHMLVIKHTDERGWTKPLIEPMRHFNIHPFNSTIHYSLGCFEGMKAYKSADDKLYLFRPMENMKRFLVSNERLAFAPFSPEELLKCIVEYVKLEKNWIPKTKHSSLYLRPTGMALEDTLGVHRASSNMIFVVASPVGSYFTGSIKLSVCEDYWRGTPHSASGYKLSSNYAPTVLIGHELAKRGYSQAIWSYKEQLLESGATNMFFVIKNKAGETEVVTHPLDGSILPGITRDSIIQLHKDIFPKYKMSERPFTITEFIECHKEGRFKEVFVTGTASVIGNVKEIELRDNVYEFNEDEQHNEYSRKMREYIVGIQHGEIKHPYAYAIPE